MSETRACAYATIQRDDPLAKRAPLPTAVRKHVEARFSVDRMTDEYLQVYQEVLRDHRSRTIGRSARVLSSAP